MQREPRPFGRPSRSPFPLLFLSLIVFAAIAGLAIYFFTAQSIEIQIGEARAVVRTHQMTVGDVLQENGLYVAPEDRVSPPLEAPLRGVSRITIDKAMPKILVIDGAERRIATRLTDPAAILAEAGITTQPGDQVETVGDVITLERARRFTLVDGPSGAAASFTTTAATVADALSAAQVILYAADQVTPPLDAPLGDRIQIERAQPIAIVADGRTLQTRTRARDVASALAEAGASLVGLDSSDPPPDAAITPNLTIRVRRVTETEESESSVIPFKRVLTPDPRLELDTIQVTQPGTDGQLDIFMRVRREDGLEVSRSAPLRWVTRPAQDELAKIGTQIIIKNLETPDGPLTYWRTLKVNAVAYKPSSGGKSAADPTFGVTTTGQPLARGIIAVDPALIPLGTQVYILNYGRAVAGDTLPGLSGGNIRLGYSESDYQAFDGPVTVYLLAPPPADGQIPNLPPDVTR